MYKIYTVTTSGIEDTDSIWDDLLSSGDTPETIPDRVVEVADERPINKRNTSYFLTEEEATALKEDPRVEDVVDMLLFTPSKHAFQDTLFDKTSTSTGTKSNWGLLRHVSATNNFGSSTSDPGGTYNYVLDGTGVDVVIIDSGIQKDHPEFTDSNGISRVKEINWFTASGIAGAMPAGHYTDYDGHGTHVAGTVAGKTFGWAKNADIYSIKLSGLQGTSDPNGGISVENTMDCILGWHNAKTNGRPTVINNSWGYNIYWNTAQNSLTLSGSAPYYAITGGSYRGTAWSGSTRDTAKGHTGALVSENVYGFPYRVSSVDADISSLINAGIIVCNSAGNDNMKIDLETGGLDSDNYITSNTLGNIYYHRGGSPHVGSGDGFQVGSLSTSVTGSLENKSGFSNAGAGVKIYAAGSNIISSMSNTNSGNTNFAYFDNASYKQEIYSGTSMASPQIAGLCALLLQAFPSWTPYQVNKWIIYNSKPILYGTGQTNDYTSTLSVFGGTQNIVYMLLNGQKPYQMLG
jgi:subtilisin family serine protease